MKYKSVPIIWFLLSVLLLVNGCSSERRRENESLLIKIDSLEEALESREYAISLLEIIGQYLDSIDFNTESVLTDLETGLEDEDYIARIKALNKYFQKTDWAIREMNKISNSNYLMIDYLKEVVDDKNDEINRLQINVNKYRDKEDSLKGKLEITASQLQEIQKSLNFSRIDLVLTEIEVMGLMEMVRLTEAEIHFVEGEGLQELAGKIRLAPKMKREKLQQALNAYTTSYEMGYPPARLKMEKLQERLKTD